MNADRESCHICDEHQPAVAVRLVGMVFPLQNKPEHDSRECRRVGVNLAFDGRKPERVAESVDECTHHTACLDGYHLSQRHLAYVRHKEFPHQMRDAPEEEQDTCGGE